MKKVNVKILKCQDVCSVVQVLLRLHLGGFMSSCQRQTRIGVGGKASSQIPSGLMAGG